jgi:hypothetical protein
LTQNNADKENGIRASANAILLSKNLSEANFFALRANLHKTEDISSKTILIIISTATTYQTHFIAFFVLLSKSIVLDNLNYY